MRAAVFGPTPGRRRKSTTPTGTRSRRFASACISPSSTTSTDLLLDRLPDPWRSVAAARERELGDRARRLPDPPGRTAVGDDLERLLAEDLGQVGRGGRAGRRAPRSGAASSPCGDDTDVPARGNPWFPREPSFEDGERPDTSYSTRATRGRLPAHVQRAREPRADGTSLGEVLDTAIDRVLVIDDRSPDGTGRDRRPPRRRSFRGSPSSTASGRRGSGRRTSRGSGGALAEGAELVLEMDCDFSHDPNDVPRLIAAAEEADLVLGSRYAAGGGTENWGLAPAGRLTRRLSLRAGAPRGARARPHRRLQVLSPGGARGDRPRPGLRARVRLPDRDDVSRAPRGLCVREVPIRFVDRRVGDSKMTGSIVAEAAWMVPLLRLRALAGRL